jgi:L-alanine-DL-glutamate epimerase-like enolase superfamily enzyme
MGVTRVSAASTFDLLRDLPLRVDSASSERLELVVSTGGFVRVTTVLRLHGAGETGVGEDVTYTPEAHPAFREAIPALPLAGDWTLESFSEQIGQLDLFGDSPEQEVFRAYRRWGVESAALDLALRQAGRSLTDVLGRPAAPVTFVCSLNLGHPPSLEGLRKRLAVQPAVRFKLDATSDWDDDVFAELVALGCVDSIDFKGAYRGTVVDQPPDAELYRRVAETFPDAWLEDPNLTPETERALEPYRDRVTWDAVIHSIDDIVRLPFPPRTVNVKPSRFGSLRALMDCYDHLERHGMGAYGGGQFELGPGRGQIQALAAIFHPDAPNDIAPGAYNLPDPPPDLPASPLEPRLLDPGFGWSVSP